MPWVCYTIIHGATRSYHVYIGFGLVNRVALFLLFFCSGEVCNSSNTIERRSFYTTIKWKPLIKFRRYPCKASAHYVQKEGATYCSKAVNWLSLLASRLCQGIHSSVGAAGRKVDQTPTRTTAVSLTTTPSPSPPSEQQSIWSSSFVKAYIVLGYW